MADVAVAHDGPRDGDRALRVVGGLAEYPLVLPIAGIARNDGTGTTSEAADTAGGPPGDVLAGQGLGLLANGVARGQPLERSENATQLRRHATTALRSHQPKRGRDWRRRSSPAARVSVEACDIGTSCDTVRMSRSA